ncbi:MAG: hypothetical protein U9P14_12405 [Gemmatimonadota bacterium]|nr:hypothetical protein [Gemmatimonadota bacterium]
MIDLSLCKRKGFLRNLFFWPILAASCTSRDSSGPGLEKDAAGKKEQANASVSDNAPRSSKDYLPRVVLIRPHHFLDIIRGFAAGVVYKPSAYGHANHLVAQWLSEDHDIMLELTLGVDAICKPCSKLVQGRCIDIVSKPGFEMSKQEFNDRTDRRLFGELGIEPGRRMSARDFCRLALERLGDNYLLYPEFEIKKPGRHAENLNRGLKQYLES